MPQILLFLRNLDLYNDPSGFAFISSRKEYHTVQVLIHMSKRDLAVQPLSVFADCPLWQNL